MSSIIHYTIAGNKSNSLTVPMVRKEEQDFHTSNTSSAEWMVRIDDMTHSASKLFPKHCELFGWYAENSCQTNGSMGFWTPAKVLKHSEVVIIIPVAGFLAKLENAMNKKNALMQVEIIRIGENVPIQTI
ncbi:MAG: hypothetical protein Q8K36_06275, partial [Alphaproteobacteria bacterium]|nr:hypothetical protein [Alphaproteobacteria bacterium]